MRTTLRDPERSGLAIRDSRVAWRREPGRAGGALPGAATDVASVARAGAGGGARALVLDPAVAARARAVLPAASDRLPGLQPRHRAGHDDHRRTLDPPVVP